MAYVTYRDLGEYLIDFMGVDAESEALRNARRAIQSSLRVVTNAFAWSYYYTRGQLTTVASYSTGTVTYTHSTRTLTLATGTWPTWAASGTVVIAGVNYKVESRSSGTDLILTTGSNPGADVAAGTSYSIVQLQYDLPDDFAAADRFIISNGFRMSAVHPRSWDDLIVGNPSTGGRPVWYCILGNPNAMGGMALYLHPYADAAYHIDFVYKRRPRGLVVYAESTGTVTTSGTAVTGSGTAFTSAMIGSVLRVSNNTTDLPDDLAGNNPFAYEARITAVASATACTVDASLGSGSGVKYVISDPVDIEQGAMLTALLRCCERELAQERTMDVEARSMATSRFKEALLAAKEADYRSTAPKGAGGYVPIGGGIVYGDDQG